MFDVGFSEMMVIAIVALVVIGPEKLPKVARTLGHLVGRLQRYVGEVKADINREMELEELRKFKDEFQSGVQAVEKTIHDEIQHAEAGVRAVADEAAAASPEGPAGEPAAPTGAAPKDRIGPDPALHGGAREPGQGAKQA